MYLCGIPVVSHTSHQLMSIIANELQRLHCILDSLVSHICPFGYLILLFCWYIWYAQDCSKQLSIKCWNTKKKGICICWNQYVFIDSCCSVTMWQDEPNSVLWWLALPESKIGLSSLQENDILYTWLRIIKCLGLFYQDGWTYVQWGTVSSGTVLRSGH